MRSGLRLLSQASHESQGCFMSIDSIEDCEALARLANCRVERAWSNDPETFTQVYHLWSPNNHWTITVRKISVPVWAEAIRKLLHETSMPI